MKNFKYTMAILLTLSLGCSSNQKAEEEKLQQASYDEVMAIHDEVMPTMSKMLKLEKELKNMVEGSDSTTSMNDERIEIVENSISMLEEADEAMMHWMRGFEVNQEGWPHDSIMSYLSKEKEKISKVRDKTLEAIKQAEEIIGN